MPEARGTAEQCVIGLDVGGTKTAAGLLVFPEGRILSQRVAPTKPGRGGEAVLRDMEKFAAELMREAAVLGHRVTGIGLGVAELVDTCGEVTSAHTIQWKGLNVRERMSRIAPTVVESDVRAAALGEALFGAGKAYDPLAFITVGTGISYSAVMGGKPYGGARGNALVLSSAPLSHTCEACGVRTHPVLEEFASGPALARRYSERCGKAIRRAEDVTAQAAQGEELALEIVRTAGEALGVSVAFLVNVLDPAAIVVGGGLGVAGGEYWTSFIASARAHIWADGSREIPILMAGLGKDAGLVGAAASYWRTSAR